MPSLRPSFGPSREADLFEAALSGGASTPARRTPADLAQLVGLADELSDLQLAWQPDPVFVARLGERLQAEAAAIAAAAPARTTTPRPLGSGGTDRRPTAARGGRGPRPVVVFVGRGLPRTLAGIVASILLVVTVVGFSSASALPGQVLYPVKQLIDRAQVGFARGDLDKGTTLLNQARDDVAEVSQLVDASQPSGEAVDTGLRSAVARTTRGQQLLVAAYASGQQAAATDALSIFVTQVTPQLDALVGRVPGSSEALLDQLRSLVGDAGRTGLTSGPLTGASSPTATGRPGGTGSSAGSAVPSSSSTAGASTTGSGGSSVSVQPSAGSSGSGGSAGTGGLVLNPPSVGASHGPVGGGVDGPTASVGSSGVSVGGGGATVTVPGGGVTATVPGISVGTGGVGIGGGGVSAPSVSVPVPGVTVSLPSSPTANPTCVLGVLCP